MVVFLFWNLNRKPLQGLLTQLVVQYQIDVLILAEFSMTQGVLLQSLYQSSVPYHYVPRKDCKKIEIFTRFPSQFMAPLYEDERLTIRHLKLLGTRDILVAAVHFPSKLHWDDASQAMESVNLAKKIRSAEKEVGHSRTILVGDLNMNPFEDGVISANGLHGVMSRMIAAKGTRVVQGTKYPFFYNPMWCLFGDASPTPPGTHYYGASTLKTFFWNMFDQLLIRPELLSSFRNDSLKILDAVGNISFMTKRGRPNPKVASDHFPLLFTIDI